MTAELAAAAVRQPLLLDPVLVPKPWGGRRLERLGRALPADAWIGESWEVADLDADATAVADPVSRVADGALAGQSLAALIAADPGGLLGAAASVDGRFPLLVKFLDAREHLSVQVHPSAAYAAGDPSVVAKTESWVVLDADPGASLWLGVADGATLEAVTAAIGTPDIVPLLRRVPAVAGEVHHVPAGTIHALGAGVLVAEVQTPSDTTFRIYDWTQEYDRAPRRLHLTEAARAVAIGWDPPAGDSSAERLAPPTGVDDSLIVATPQYRIHRRELLGGQRCRIDGGTARVLMVTAGALDADALPGPLSVGGVTVLPAAFTGTVCAEQPTTVLDIIPAAADPQAGDDDQAWQAAREVR